MTDRTQRFLAEVGRFLVVGGAATAVAFVIFNLLLHGPGGTDLLRDHPITAYVLANTVGMVISYHGSRNWAFADRPPRTADGGLTAYVAINVVTMTIPIVCLTLSRHALGLADPVSDNLSANAVGLLLGLVARFYLFRRFVFHGPVTTAPGVVAHAADTVEAVEAVRALMHRREGVPEQDVGPHSSL